MTRCGCPEEDKKQKAESPDIVGDPEALVFALVCPTSANIQSVAHLHSGRLKDRALSLCRAAFCTYADMLKHVVEPQLKDSSRTYLGYHWMTCSEVRSILAPPNPADQPAKIGAFCVIDDGDSTYPAHARAGYSGPTQQEFWKKHSREAARGTLLLKLQARGIFKDEHSPPFRNVAEARGD